MATISWKKTRMGPLHGCHPLQWEGKHKHTQVQTWSVSLSAVAMRPTWPWLQNHLSPSPFTCWAAFRCPQDFVSFLGHRGVISLYSPAFIPFLMKIHNFCVMSQTSRLSARGWVKPPYLHHPGSTRSRPEPADQSYSSHSESFRVGHMA